MGGEAMELGAFAMSLAVADLGTSRPFYQKPRFEQTRGDGEHYLIMVNGQMVEKNNLTLNPGSGQDTEHLGDSTDIRDLRNRLADVGIEVMDDHNPEGTGPASISPLDPDGNPVLIDQFIPRPRSAEDSGQYDYSDSQPLSRLTLGDGSPGNFSGELM